jgi:DNA repair protein RecO (recombination protein O)
MRAQVKKCIILGHKNISEKDKLIFLYNEEMGKIKAIARGSRKITSRFTGHLETLNLCNASLYFGPKTTLITEIETIEDFKKMDYTLANLLSVLQVVEITDKILYENQRLENLIKLIEKTIKHLKSSKNPELIAMAYIVKILDKVGLLPDFHEINFQKEKYRKLFLDLQNKSLSEVEEISLDKTTDSYTKKTIKTFIESQLDCNLTSFLN